jgi:preprotein translocase subunit SecE
MRRRFSRKDKEYQVVDKIVKAKQPEKTKPAGTVQVEKPRQPEKAKQVSRSAEKDREKPKAANPLVRFYRESVGELRKVSWPSLQDTRRLTIIVLIVMFVMSALLGLLDFLFSEAIRLLIA